MAGKKQLIFRQGGVEYNICRDGVDVLMAKTVFKTKLISWLIYSPSLNSTLFVAFETSLLTKFIKPFGHYLIPSSFFCILKCKKKVISFVKKTIASVCCIKGNLNDNIYTLHHVVWFY